MRSRMPRKQIFLHCHGQIGPDPGGSTWRATCLSASCSASMVGNHDNNAASDQAVRNGAEPEPGRYRDDRQ